MNSLTFSHLLATSLVANNGGWAPYTKPDSILLSILLFVLGIGLILFGRRRKNPLGLPHPGRILKIVIFVIWVLSILIFLWVFVYLAERTHNTVPTGPIFPITVASAICTFIYLVYQTRQRGILPALGNGFIGAMVGPMVFEFPFDWIVIPLQTAQSTYLAIFFAPLFALEITTFSLLLLSRRVSITKNSFYSLAAMFLVFAGWALVGFAYPTNPISFVLNAISKILSFTTVATLFSKESKKVTND